METKAPRPYEVPTSVANQVLYEFPDPIGEFARSLLAKREATLISMDVNNALDASYKRCSRPDAGYRQDHSNCGIGHLHVGVIGVPCLDSFSLIYSMCRGLAAGNRVLMASLPEHYEAQHEPYMLAYGFTKILGPVVNYNSGNPISIYAYVVPEELALATHGSEEEEEFDEGANYNEDEDHDY